MDDLTRYQRDRNTVMAIIKYTLYLLIAIIIVYFSTKIIIVIFPFLLGFVLAKASRHIANGVIRIQDSISGRKKTVRIYTPPKPAPVKKSVLRKLLFPMPAKKRMSRRVRISVIAYVILLILCIASTVFCVTALIVQINKVINAIPGWFAGTNFTDRITSFLTQFPVDNGGILSSSQMDKILEYLQNIRGDATKEIPTIITGMLQSLLSVASNIPIILFWIIVVIMSGFYFLTDSKKVLDFFSRNIDSRTFRHKSILLINHLSSTLFRVLGGYLALLIITFFEALFIFVIAHVPYAVILALITAVLDFMPVLGVSATMVPLIIYFIIQGNYTAVLILFIGMMVITVLRRIIEPPILGNAMNMHPLATLFAMIVGVAIWGAIGFLMGPVVLLIVIEVARSFSLDKKVRKFVGKTLSKFAAPEEQHEE